MGHLDPKKPSICSFCARMKRGMLYSCMREHGYNVLCLGQHLDDFAESLLMSAFHNGALRTMKANYYVEAHDLRVARPLVYVRERVMAQFAKENHLPIIQDNCPACFSAPKERHRIKLVLSQQEFEHPQLFWSLLKCMKPLISITHTERHLRGTGILGDADEDEEAAPVKDILETVLNDGGPAKGAEGNASSSGCADGICGLGSDGACGLGSDDQDVAEAELIGAGEDLAARPGLAGQVSATNTTTCEGTSLFGGDGTWRSALIIAPVCLAALALIAQKRGR